MTTARAFINFVFVSKTGRAAWLCFALLALCSCKDAGKPAGGDDFTRLSNLGKSHLDRSEAAPAVEVFRKALAANPTHPDAHLNLANAFLLANQPDAAVKEAQEVLNQDRHNAAAHYVAGCAYLRQNQFVQALQELQGSRDIDASVAAVSFQIGVAHQGAGHADEAITAFEQTVELDPEHPAAHYRLSQLLLRVGKKDEAAAALERHRAVLAKKPNPPADLAAYERCKHTQARVPFKLEQPDPQGIAVTFADATAQAFGGSTNYHGPAGVLDLAHDGRNSLFVLEGGAGFRLLVNSNGIFQPHEKLFPALPGNKYHRCLVGELHQDRFEDVIVLGEKGSHVFKFVTNAGITEVSGYAGLKDLPAIDGVLVDLDFTGKLDLLALGADGQTARSFRNLGNFFFRENTATSGLPAALTSARQIVFDDWNNDDLADLLIARDGQPPLLVSKLRGGPLAVTNQPAGWPAGSVIATGDLNNDLRTDLVVAAADKLEIIFGGTSERTSVPLGGLKARTLKLVDYDNDGWLDLVAGGDGLRGWRNAGRAGFRDATAALGFDKLGSAPIESITAADFDGDCDTELLLDRASQGLQLLRNDGGYANHQVKIQLFGRRSNPSGLGIRLELTAGGLRASRTVTQLPIEIGVGRRAEVDSINARWFDLEVNAVEIKVDCPKLLTLDEPVLPTGSCPYLYAWDGHRFRFVTDLLGASPLGLRVSEHRFVEADQDEFVWIGNETNFPPRGGHYVLHITEELREVLYLDEAKLVVVDHPPGTEVHTTGKLVPGKPFPPHQIVTLHNRVLLRHAANHDGADVTARLAEADGQFVSPTRLRVPQLRGLAEPHGVTLDFGPLAVERPLVLALTGWLRFGGGMANVGASHNPELPFPFPVLEVETAGGEWKKVDVVVGAPAGKTKTILVDLSGQLPRGARRLRLGAAFEIHWDRIALFEKRDGSETRLATHAVTKSDLHRRGYSEFEERPWSFPLTPSYDKVTPCANWRITPQGWYTRYGDVGELIGQRDNALALVAGGDELTLSFAADALPPRPADAARDFFLFTSGWDKDADFHCELGWQVEPLPWHGLNDQLYGRETRPPFANDGWMKQFNTRWVGPYTMTRAGGAESSKLSSSPAPRPRRRSGPSRL